MYIYETHLHTYEGSQCGTTKGKNYPAYYKALGYDGIFITDHFFNGNCRIPHYKDWEKRVNAFCKGFENAKKAGDEIGFKVFFGWEANFNGDEFLIYGLDKEWLLNHPDILSYSREQQYETIHRDGGLVVQAHPFRERDYLNTIYLNPDTCDAMEAYNSSNKDYQNDNAHTYCSRNDIFMTAGSDLHKIGSLKDSRLYGMAFGTPLNDGSDYVRRIKDRQGTLYVPASDIHPAQSINTTLPVITN